jgi:ABC-2 type transport system ATP-binding protein
MAGLVTLDYPTDAMVDAMLFTLHGITKTYGKIAALRDLSVNVSPGAIGLLGPNGAGKTTLIRALLGLIAIDAGSGEVLGLDLRRRRLDIRQAVGFVPEDECLFPGVAGVDFVAYAGELCGMSRTNALQRAHEVLNHVELGEARYRSAESYSAGMKQRLKLASALVHDPRLLILDEPTNGMDPAGRKEMLELARDLAHGKEMSLLFSSHLMPDVEFVCDHVLVLAQGRLVAQGQIQDLMAAHDRCFEVRVKRDAEAFARRLGVAGCVAKLQNSTVLVHLPPERSPQVLWEVAAAGGEQIRHLRPQRSTLEEVFLRAIEQDGN